ncbi:MAG: M48 family metalloprotease, partial [Bacteroidetes bacterium]|nr:M48 family metalloprotease [Bacteroidota bacterium]
MIQLLTDEELLAIIGHELGHVHLCRQLGGDVEIAHRIVTAVANHPGASAAHYESARLFKLYAEIFCDRAGAFVAGHYAPVVAALVKMATGLPTVNVESYVRQAEEIFTHEGGLRTTGITHPENFIRARALHLWHNKVPEAEDIIRRMIEGHTSLDGLDLLRQQELTGLTRQLLQLAMQPLLMQTEATVALVKQYFATFDR